MQFLRTCINNKINNNIRPYNVSKNILNKEYEHKLYYSTHNRNITIKNNGDKFKCDNNMDKIQIKMWSHLTKRKYIELLFEEYNYNKKIEYSTFINRYISGNIISRINFTNFVLCNNDGDNIHNNHNFNLKTLTMLKNSSNMNEKYTEYITHKFAHKISQMNKDLCRVCGNNFSYYNNYIDINNNINQNYGLDKKDIDCNMMCNYFLHNNNNNHENVNGKNNDDENKERIISDCKIIRSEQNILQDFFVKAYLNNDYEVIEDLLKSGLYIKFTHDKIYNPLNTSILNGKYEITELIIKYHAEYLDFRDFFGCTPLIQALKIQNIYEREKFVTQILKAGADPNYVGYYGQNTHFSIPSVHYTLNKYWDNKLISHPLAISCLQYVLDISNNIPHTIIQYGIIEMLINYGADVNCTIYHNNKLYTIHNLALEYNNHNILSLINNKI